MFVIILNKSRCPKSIGMEVDFCNKEAPSSKCQTTCLAAKILASEKLLMPVIDTMFITPKSPSEQEQHNVPHTALKFTFSSTPHHTLQTVHTSYIFVIAINLFSLQYQNCLSWPKNCGTVDSTLFHVAKVLKEANF